MCASRLQLAHSWPYVAPNFGTRYAPLAAGDPAASHAAQQQAVSRHLRNADAEREGAPSPRAGQLDRAVSLVRKGMVGKAAAMLTNAGVAPVGKETAGILVRFKSTCL